MALVRDLLKSSKLSNVFDFTNLSNTGNLKNVCSTVSVRTAKHYDPKFRWLRSKKYIKVDLPKTERWKELNKKWLKDFKLQSRIWKDRPLTITSASDIFDPYKPEVGDGKTSILSKGISGLTTATKTKMIDTTALRKIKNYDTNFKKNLFVQEAQDIYVNAHTVLMDKDPEALSKYVTERANAEMMDSLKNKTVRWKFLESLEPPVVVQARTQEVILKSNLFAQLTVRFHSKQTLAIYDRFGRLMYGSEFIPKDVLEYVVFEKHINNENGVWRLHGKIIPEWREPQTALTRTYRIEESVEDDEEEAEIFESDPESDIVPGEENKATAEIVQAETKPSH